MDRQQFVQRILCNEHKERSVHGLIKLVMKSELVFQMCALHLHNEKFRGHWTLLDSEVGTLRPCHKLGNQVGG